MNVNPDLIGQGWKELEKSIVHYRGRPVGTVAARDPSLKPLNYGQCFIRDFAVSAVAFLLRGDMEIVRNFLTVMADLQTRERHMDCFRPSRGLMPASFKVESRAGEDVLAADFGEHAIARVSPVDSGFWWLILLRAYTKASGDTSLAASPACQEAIRLVLELCLAPRFDMYPAMLVPDGSYMIDRRLGVYGYPFDIQALFHASLRAAQELLAEEDEYQKTVRVRLDNLCSHVQRYYWLDLERLNSIYRYRVEQYGENVVNVFNIHPASIPDWVLRWMPSSGGFFAGNLGPGRMDFRYFAQGNLMSVVTSLANPQQADEIMTLIERRWDDLMGEMPVKLCFPALEGQDWYTVTGADRKNVPWSYHNSGNWPFLLWLLAAAAIRTGREDLAERALEQAMPRLVKAHWAEYFDGRDGRLVGKEARAYQTWSIAGVLGAYELLRNPARIGLFSFEFDEAAAGAATGNSASAKTHERGHGRRGDGS